MFQSWPQPQISCTKRANISPALDRVRDFRVELHGVEAWRDSSAIAAIGQDSLLAMTLKPAGSSVTLSPWLIQTSSRPWPSALVRSWMPLNSSEWPRARISA